MNSAQQLARAQQQVARAWGCGPRIFTDADHTFLLSEDVFFEMLSFGYGTAFRMDGRLLRWAMDTFDGIETSRIMDSRCLYGIETALRAHGQHLAGEHVRYLRLLETEPIAAPPGFAYRHYLGDAVRALYAYPGYDNALNYRRDVIAVAAFDGDTLAGLAAADDHMGDLWQIGIDVLAPYRHRGLAVHLVDALSRAIIAQDKLPFYTTWSANIASTRVALRCGYRPAWVGYYAQSQAED